jgi:hypothetical protein
MFKNLFGKKEQTPLIDVRWDNAYIVFIAVLVNVHGNKLNIEPSNFLNIVAKTLADNNFSMDEHKMQDVIAGYFDYSMQPERYRHLLDLMFKDSSMKNNESYTSHLLEITKIFSSFMIGAQDFLSRHNSNFTPR